MPTLLALDLATRTGFALAPVPTAPLPTFLEAVSGVPVPEVKSGTVRFGHEGCSLGVFMHAARRWLDKLIKESKISDVVFEAPILPPKTQIGTLRKLYGLTGAVEELCVEHHLAVYEANNPTVYKHFGTGGKTKADRKVNAMAACTRYGWPPATDDEADALMLWHYGASILQRHMEPAA